MKMVEKENDIAPVVAVPNNAVAENVSSDDAATDPAAPAPTKEIPNNNKKSTAAEDLMGLARLFLKEYYTKLSDCPGEAGHFYGDDSHFVHGDTNETGRENIQRAIGKMNFEDCKARFYSLKAVLLSLQGDEAKMLQVCGELTLVKGQQPGEPIVPRRFVQTIVLAHQTPTMLYVKSDVFQWIDTAFLITTGDKYSPANNAGNAIPSPPTIEQQQPLENGGQISPPMVNGNGGGQHPRQHMIEEPKKSSLASNGPVAKVIEEPKKSPSPQVEAQGGLEELKKPPAMMPPKVGEPAALPAPAPLKKEDAVVAHPQQQTVPLLPSTEPNNATLPSAVPTLAKAKATGGSYAAIAAAVKCQQQSYNSQSPAPQQQLPRTVQQQKTTEIATNNNATTVLSVAAPPPVATDKAQVHPSPPVLEPAQPRQQHKEEGNEVTKQPQHQQQRSGSTDAQQQTLSPPPTVSHMAPRKEWSHRIYFTQLNKPGRFVDFRQGQQELMREVLAITEGVEFVGIKPNSLRREYRSAFGFIDLTTASDVQAVYDACKKDSNGVYRLKVSIPTFDFNGTLSLSADKTSNLIGGATGREGGQQPQQQYRQSNQQGY